MNRRAMSMPNLFIRAESALISLHRGHCLAETAAKNEESASAARDVLSSLPVAAN
jgi:hypothetical protein